MVESVVACVPVAFFVHSRLEHTSQTITALQANDLADRTPLYIFSDAARIHREGEAVSVANVRQYISGVAGFFSVNIVERETNWGLKRNIIDGLNYVLERHDRVIVIEDDCVTTPDFLRYMNYCLFRYKTDESVWHISGWSPVVDLLGDIYRSNFMSCWGWATWRDKWRRLDLDAIRLMSKMSLKEKYRFSINGSYPFYSHLVGNYLEKNSTWAIFWAATIFTNGGVCVGPVRSKVKNIGMDDSGTHKAVIFEQASSLFSNENAIAESVSSGAASKAIGMALRKNLSAVQIASMYIKMLAPVWLYRYLRKL